MARRRIALVLPVYWPAIGGSELTTRELAVRLAQRHDVRIITLIDSEQDKHAHELWLAAILRAPQQTTVTWDGALSVTRPSMGPAQRFFYAMLARVQSPKLPDWIVCAAMERLADHYRRRLEPLLEGVDVVHSVHGGASFFGYAALLAARRLRLPFVYTPLMHLPGGRAELSSRGPGTPPPAPRLVPRTWTDVYWKRIWQQADAVLAMTDYERDYYVREGVPANRAHRTGVGPMLPSSPGQSAMPVNGQDAEAMVLFLARNTLAKGVALVLQAAPLVWAKFPRVRFTIAGPRAPETDALVGEVIDPRISILGEVSEAQKDALMRRCTVYCMPSREESLGATYLEAWSHGKPIVGLRIPPLQELNEGERGGLLADPTSRDVADKLLLLLAKPEMMRDMGDWGRQRTLARYSWDTITARTESIYESLLHPAPGEAGRAVPRDVR